MQNFFLSYFDICKRFFFGILRLKNKQTCKDGIVLTCSSNSRIRSNPRAICFLMFLKVPARDPFASSSSMAPLTPVLILCTVVWVTEMGERVSGIRNNPSEEWWKLSFPVLDRSNVRSKSVTTSPKQSCRRADFKFVADALGAVRVLKCLGAKGEICSIVWERPGVVAMGDGVVKPSSTSID